MLTGATVRDGGEKTLASQGPEKDGSDGPVHFVSLQQDAACDRDGIASKAKERTMARTTG